MRRWHLKLDDYGIDRYLYDELRAFCRQYADKRARLSAIRGGFNNLQRDGMPGGGQTGDPTARRAAQAIKYQNDLDAIERALNRACEPGMRETIRNNVCYGMRYEEMSVPAGRRQFFIARRMFFYRLAVELGKIAE